MLYLRNLVNVYPIYWVEMDLRYASAGFADLPLAIRSLHVQNVDV